MRAALRGLSETFGVACPTTWPAATSCSAWGAPSAHGCKRNPGHDGLCRCACGRERPIDTYGERPSDLTVIDPQVGDG